MSAMDMLQQALVVSGWGMLWGFGVSALLYLCVWALNRFVGQHSDVPYDKSIPEQ